MIIGQGYKMWATIISGAGHVDFEPVIAWRYEPGERPVPIGATKGELKLSDLGAYLVAQESVDKLERDLAHARDEARQRAESERPEIVNPLDERYRDL